VQPQEPSNLTPGTAETHQPAGLPSSLVKGGGGASPPQSIL